MQIRPQQSAITGRGTVLQFARSRDGKGSGAGKRQPAGARPGRPRDISLDARALELETREDEFLQQALDDPAPETAAFSVRALRNFDFAAEEAFGGIADPALRASAFRKAVPARARLQTAALDLEREIADGDLAVQILTPAERILGTPDASGARVGPMLDRVADLIEESDLAPERKQQLAVAITARAIARGLDDRLGPRFARHRAMAQKLFQTAPPDQNASAIAARAGERPPRVLLAADPNQEPAEEGALNDMEALTPANEFRANIDAVSRVVDELARMEPDAGIERFGDKYDLGSRGSLLRRGIEFLLVRNHNLSERHARSVARRTGLDEDTFVLFRDIGLVTPETLDSVRRRWRRRLLIDRSLSRGQQSAITAIRGKIERHLKEVAGSRNPGNRLELYVRALTFLRFLLPLAVPMSKQQEQEVIEEANRPFNSPEGSRPDTRARQLGR